MMLTIKQRTQLAGLHAGNGRAASKVVLQTIGIVGSGIRVVFLGDSSPISSEDSRENSLFTTHIPNNYRCPFYRYEAAATDQSKPRRGDDHPSEDGGRDGGVLSGQRWC